MGHLEICPGTSDSALNTWTVLGDLRAAPGDLRAVLGDLSAALRHYRTVLGDLRAACEDLKAIFVLQASSRHLILSASCLVGVASCTRRVLSWFVLSCLVGVLSCRNLVLSACCLALSSLV